MDVIINGAGANLAEAMGCLKPGGWIVVVGSTAGSTVRTEVPDLYFGQYRFSGEPWKP